MSHTDMHAGSKHLAGAGPGKSEPEEEDWPEPELSELSLAGSLSGTFGARAAQASGAAASVAPPAPVPQKDIPGLRCVTGSFPLDSVLREADSIPLTATGSFAVAGLPRVDLMSLGPETPAPPAAPAFDPFLPPPTSVLEAGAQASAPAAASGFVPGRAADGDFFGGRAGGSSSPAGRVADPFSASPMPDSLVAAMDAIPTTSTGSFALPSLPKVDLMALSAPPPPPQAFAPAPQAFAPAPQAYAPAPQPYAPAPQAYAQAPQAFAPAPQAYAPAPQAFAPAPQAFAPAPQAFAPAPQAFAPAPQAAAPAPAFAAPPPSPPGANMAGAARAPATSGSAPTPAARAGANAPAVSTGASGPQSAPVGPRTTAEQRQALSKTELQNMARQALERQKDGKRPAAGPALPESAPAAVPSRLSSLRGVLIGVFLGSLTLAALIFMGRV